MKVGAVGPPDDSDVLYRFNLTNVMRQDSLAEYTGEVQVRLGLRITDRDNTPHPGGPGAATTVDLPFSFTVACTATAENLLGSTCALNTSAESVLPGSITEGGRAIWELDQVKVLDGGPDGDVETPDNSLLAVQGVFVP